MWSGIGYCTDPSERPPRRSLGGPLRALALIAAAVALSGCGLDLPEPDLRAVAPDFGYNGDDTRVSLEGRGFFPQVEADATRRGSGDVDRTFEARLVGPVGVDNPLSFDLVGETLESYTRIDAIVPRGLPPGTYDVEVEGPSGRVGRLPHGFTVTHTRADRLRLDASSVVYEVHTWAWIDVELVDPEGRRVLTEDSFEVAVEVRGDDGPVVARFDDDALEGQEPLPDGVGLLGDLGADGYARVGLYVETPQTVTVTVGPLDRSGVADGSLKLLWEAGDELSVDVALPDAPFVGTVGEPFSVDLQLLDQHGNAVEDRSQVVVLTNECGGFARSVALDGHAQVEVSLKTATGTTGCPSDRLVTLAGPPGQSEPITLLPGPIDAFQVVASPDTVVAGEPDLNVFATPVDRYGNRTHWPGGALTLTDSVGGVGDFDCEMLSIVHCTVVPVVAASDVVLTVSDDHGTTGLSDTYTVVPGAPVALEVEVDAERVVAGEPFDVAVRGVDAFGNPVDASGAAVAFSSPLEPPDCVSTGGSGPVARFSCALFTADAAASLSASTGGLTGDSAPFPVVNGPLHEVVITPAASEVVAGESLSLAFRGLDAWGNPYREQDDPALQVSDASGRLSVTAVTLDADGEATVAGVFDRAGETFVVASRGGVELGRSDAVTVRAAAASALVVLTPPWAWVDVPETVSVAARDPFGNLADLDGAATLSSTSGEHDGVVVPLVDGLGAADLTWTAPRLDERLDATAGALTGSGALPVVDDCAEGPVPELRFGGTADAITCFDDLSGEAALSGSFAGSTPGQAPLALYGLSVVGGEAATSPSDAVLVGVDGVGAHPLVGLVADADGCGAEIGATAWVGPDDGSPVGPIGLEMVPAAVPIGSGVAEIRLDGVVDCSRDPAAGRTVFVRADRGALVGAAPTGQGLAVQLDAAGSAVVDLDAGAVRTGGPVGIRAWVPSGAASGAASGQLDGDDRKPRVWRQEPSGQASGLVDEIVLGFSEPLLPATVVPERFAVVGPELVAVSDVTLSGDEVVVQLASPVDAGSGEWTLTVADGVRDLAGNRLDGRGDGTTSAYTGWFGALPPAAAPPEACEASTERFRPDGDDGAGIEADTVTIAFGADAVPEAWVASVLDDADRLLRRERFSPAGADDAWTWDGRDASERVVADGEYRVEVDADDGMGNRVGGCSVRVRVDNRPLE